MTKNVKPADPSALSETERFLNTPSLPLDTNVDRPPTVFEQADAAEKQRLVDENDAHKLSGGEKFDRFRGSNTPFARMLDWAALKGMPDDPQYSLPDDLHKTLEMTGIPLNWIDEYAQVRSQEQFNYLTNHLRTRADDQNQVAKSGGAGIAMNLAANLMDPVTFAAAAAGGEAGAVFGGASRVAQLAKTALGGGVGNVAAANTFGDEDHRFLKDFATDFASGAAFGAVMHVGMGAFSRPEREAFAQVTEKYGKQAADGFEKGAPAEAGSSFGPDTLSSARAADDSVVGKIKSAVDNLSQDPAQIPAPELDRVAVNRDEFKTLSDRAEENANLDTLGKYFRIDGFAKGARSKFAEIRQITREFLFDPVKVVDRENPDRVVQNTAGLHEEASFDAKNNSRDMYASLENAKMVLAKEEAGGNYLKAQLLLDNPEWVRSVENRIGRVKLTGTADAHAAINEAANYAGTSIEKSVNQAVSSGVTGAEGLVHDAGYFPHQIDPFAREKLRGLGVRDGDVEDAVKTLYTKALDSGLRKAGKTIDIDVTEKSAAALTRRMLRPGMDHAEAFSHANFAYLEDVLKTSGMKPEAIDGILSHFEGRDPTSEPRAASSASDRFKQRLPLDMNVSTDLPSGEKLTLADLYNTNVREVVDKYSREMAGHSALARRGYSEKGMRETFDTLHSQAKMDDSMHGFFNDLLSATLGKQMKHDRDGTLNQLVSTFGSFNTATKMLGVFWSQIGDSGAALASAGMRASMMHVGALRELMAHVTSDKMSSDLAREMASMGNPGSVMVRNPISRVPRKEDYRGLYGNRIYKAFDAYSRRAAHTVINKIGLLGPMMARQQQHVSASLAQKFADIATGRMKLTPEMTERFVDGGFSKADLDRSLDFVKNHAELDQHGVIQKLNMAQMPPDLERSLGMFIHREVNRVILEHGPESNPAFMHSLLGRMSFQFRGYTLNAYSRRFLHSLVRHDVQAGTSMLYGMSLASAAVLGRTWLNYGSDSKQFKELMDPTKLALTAFERTGESGLAPMMIDTVGHDILGRDAIFGNRGRSSGQDVSFLGGNAYYTTMKDFANVLGIPSHVLAPDRSVTQDQVKSLFNLTGLRTLTGARRFIDAYAGTFPKKGEETQPQ
jgi:hypothetical protein